MNGLSFFRLQELSVAYPTNKSWSISHVWIFFCLLSFIGCTEKEILRGLDARQSIDIFVILQQNGIQAGRERDASVRGEQYLIMVSGDDYARALEVLHSYGLPKEEKESIESLTKGQGFVPPLPELSAARLDFVLALKVERLLSALSGVVKVSAVIHANLNRNVNFNFPGNVGASVILSCSPSFRDAFSIDEVKKIVAQAVPGLIPSEVEVTIKNAVVLQKVKGIQALDETQQEEMRLAPLWKLGTWRFGFHIPESERFLALTELLVVVLVVGLCALAVGYIAGIKRRPREEETG